ncbi:MAG: hypothetical protein GY803_12490 [Chloroflexi bacterium]|nr:hypothetical protein [Chloroflexota bacterium]
MQRKIEAAGISAITLSFIPDLTASVSVPRLVGIGHPAGLPFGLPGDAAMQTAVLHATLNELKTMRKPGIVKHLPFEWPPHLEKIVTGPTQPPPIKQYLKRRPHLYPRLLTQNIPQEIR